MEIKNLCKSFGDKKVLDMLSFSAPCDGKVCIMGASGAGKTTLIRILMGLESADSGIISGAPTHFSAVFQNDTLCEYISALKNVMIVARRDITRSDVISAFESVGITEKEALMPVCEFSGGMKRRCSVVRAMCAEGEYVYLDEPFKGLDVVSHKLTAEYILSALAARGLMAVTHEKDDSFLLGAQIIQIDKSE